MGMERKVRGVARRKRRATDSRIYQHDPRLFCLIGEKMDIGRYQNQAAQSQGDGRANVGVASLPVHVAPYQWENFESFMFRVLERNALQSIPQTLQLLEPHIGEALGVDPTTFWPMVPRRIDSLRHVTFGHQVLAVRHIAWLRSRLCPLCVAERGYGSLDWMLAPLAVCPAHGVYLVDHCACAPSKPLLRTRPAYSLCSCGSDLLDISTSSASHGARVLAREVSRQFRQRAGGEVASTFPILATWPTEARFSDLLDLVILLGCFGLGQFVLVSRFHRAVYSMAVVREQFEKAAYILTHWRGGFASALRIAVGPEAARAPTFSRTVSIAKSIAARYVSPLLYEWLIRGHRTATYVRTSTASSGPV
ncbi:TniQ family protein [Ralstonia solanacearum P673]|uniref:TniQ family protein n=2 Tax=Ralstonia solanacearum TaxID=305 RepID=UPI00385768E2